MTASPAGLVDEVGHFFSLRPLLNSSMALRRPLISVSSSFSRFETVSVAFLRLIRFDNSTLDGLRIRDVDVRARVRVENARPDNLVRDFRGVKVDLELQVGRLPALRGHRDCQRLPFANKLKRNRLFAVGLHDLDEFLLIFKWNVGEGQENVVQLDLGLGGRTILDHVDCE